MAHQSIAAANTIIRRPSDGELIGYNTDCEAAITAIEDALLKGNSHTRKSPTLHGNCYASELFFG